MDPLENSNVAICHISVALNINLNNVKDVEDTKSFRYWTIPGI